MTEQTILDASVLEGRMVFSSEGSSVGEVGAVFLDKDTQRPEWLSLRRGILGQKQILVPVAEIELRDNGIGVPYSASQIENAPDVEGTEVSESTERALASHYGVPYSKQRSQTGLAGDAPQRGRSSGRGTRGADGDDRTRDELYAEAKRLGIEGRSKMNKRELARAVDRGQSGGGRGQAGVANPIEVQAFLEGVDYPVRKADLVRVAQQQGANAEVRRTLERIRDEKFDNPADVSEAIGRLS